MKEYLVFDWGGTYLKYALMNEETEIIEQGKVPAPSRTGTKEDFMTAIDAIVLPVKERIAGIAVSSPGILDSASGTIRVVAVFPYLQNTCISEEFEQRYGVPVSLENDAKAAALAELWKGNLQGVSDGAVMVLGTGVGGGLILNGKLRRGDHFFAGEFSSVCTDLTRPADPKSYWGELSTSGLCRKFAEAYDVPANEMNGHRVFELINDNDEKADRLFREYTDSMALQLFSLNILLDLQKICIGGGISEQPVLMEYLQRSVEELKNYQPDLVSGLDMPLPNVDVCRFRNDANLIGALYHHLYE